MNWQSVDWSSLKRLRAAFLAGNAGQADYWQSESDLASYDATFAQRIGWKWDWVLKDLTRLGWQSPSGSLLDWGCGSGIAHRVFLDHFGGDSVSSLHLCDRSSLAVQFAGRRAALKYPHLSVQAGSMESPALLLISHVLSELTQQQATELADLAAQAQAVIWVEPGSYECSLALIAIRERLRDRMRIVAPCTHPGQCGMLSPGNERHWCHFFADPPRFVFTEGNWARFASFMEIDLRSLPLSYLVLDKRTPPAPAPAAARVIGRPRVYKGHALLLGCDASGVSDRRMDKRKFPDHFRQMKKGRLDSLQHWQAEHGVISTLQKQLP